ncbi:MAG: toll/interleukin-1 receptor domain-containing protein [Caldimonas sp.]
MDGLFISYRRQDASGYAGRLRDHLRARFGGQVFQDVDDIADGEIFEQVLERALQACRVGLVVIGPNWLTCVDAAGGRRLDAPDDWVRTEIRQLLERGIRVIPVLVGGARMPIAADLPADLQPLAGRQAREMRDASWDADVAALMKRLDEALGRTPVPAAVPPRRRPFLLAGAAALMLILVAVSWTVWSSRAGRAALPQLKSEASQSDVHAGVTSDAASATGPAADPTLAAARALALPGTRWTMEDFSGMDPEPGGPTTFEFVVSGGTLLLQSLGSKPQRRMRVTQIHGRSIVLLPQPADGKPFEFMYVFELTADASKLEGCQTKRVDDLAALGPCQWRYHRAEAATSDVKVATLLPTPVTCGKSLPSDADPACVSAVQAAGLLGSWNSVDGKTAYSLDVRGRVVQLRSAALRSEPPWRLLVRSVADGKVSLAWAGMNNRPEAFDAMTWLEYDLVAIGGGKRLVKCRAITQLSTRQEAADCSDVPAFLVQQRGG